MIVLGGTMEDLNQSRRMMTYSLRTIKVEGETMISQMFMGNLTVMIIMVIVMLIGMIRRMRINTMIIDAQTGRFLENMSTRVKGVI